MATIKPILNPRADRHGRRMLVLQIIHERHRGVVFTRYRLRSEEFDVKKASPLRPTERKHAGIMCGR